MDRTDTGWDMPEGLLDDLQVSVGGAHAGLAGLLGLLAGGAPGHQVPARELQVLLQPLADQVEQAAQVLGVAHQRRR